MESRFARVETKAENKMISLFILIFFISFIDSYRLLSITFILTAIYSIINCKNINFIRLTKPVLPFVILMILPILVKYIGFGSLENLEFTIMIIGKVLISSILLGTIVSSHSALYLVDGILNIGLPSVFNRILALTFRYFHMINEDMNIGRKALDSRGFRERNTLSSLAIFGEWIGGFFLKSAYHGDMVFNAMKSRGFQGETRNEGIKNKKIIIQSLILILVLWTILVIDRKV